MPGYRQSGDGFKRDPSSYDVGAAARPGVRRRRARGADGARSDFRAVDSSRDSLGTTWYYAVELSRPVHGGLNPSELRALGLRPADVRATSAPASTRWESRRW